MSFLTWIGLTAHQVVSDRDLKRSLFSHQKVFELCRVTYACGLMRMCVEVRDEILLRGGKFEAPENSNFRERVKW